MIVRTKIIGNYSLLISWNTNTQYDPLPKFVIALHLALHFKYGISLSQMHGNLQKRGFRVTMATANKNSVINGLSVGRNLLYL